MNTSILSSVTSAARNRLSPLLLAAIGAGAALATLSVPQVHADSLVTQSLRFSAGSCEVLGTTLARCDTNDPLHPSCTTAFASWCQGEGGAVTELLASSPPQEYVTCLAGVSSLAPCDTTFIATCESRDPGALYINYQAAGTSSGAGLCILPPIGLAAGTFCCDVWTHATSFGEGCFEIGAGGSCPNQIKVDCTGNSALHADGDLEC
jgi:hypothetical protein